MIRVLKLKETALANLGIEAVHEIEDPELARTRAQPNHPSIAAFVRAGALLFGRFVAASNASGSNGRGASAPARATALSVFRDGANLSCQARALIEPECFRLHRKIMPDTVKNTLRLSAPPQ